MTPQEARRRAEEILRQQDTGAQIVQLNSDGSLKTYDTPARYKQKVNMLHDPHGEYA